MNFYLRIYPPGHPFGSTKLWHWEVCSLNEIQISGTSDDQQDCMDVATSALDGVMQQEAVNGSAEE